LASSLRETNDYFAIRLADRAFDRFMMHFAAMRGQFNTLKSRLAPGDPETVGCFAHALASKLTPASVRLLERALGRQREINKLTESVFASLGKTQNQQVAQLEREIAILQAILNYEKTVKGKDWTLSSGGMFKVQEDFVLLFDYYSEENMRRLERFAHRWQFLFLSDAEKKEFEALPSDQVQQRENWLQTHVWVKMHPLWYFVFSICRLLQSGENNLLPVDAYWLGLVDEVLGVDLFNEREFVENPLPQQNAG
jgi:hypothetical protein